MDQNTTEYDTLWELIKDIRIAMVTHHADNGQMHAHPLTTQNKALDERAELYYFISTDSELHHRIQVDNEVSVTYADPGADRYVAIAGQGSFINDPVKKQELWSTAAKAWFPAGPTDPTLALLVVRMEHAEYWDVKESKMMQVFKMAKAAATGKPAPRMGEHKELRL